MNKHNLYTVVLEFRGGTYVAQARGKDVSSALLEWITQLNNEDLVKWGLDREKLLSTHALTDPVGLTDCINVWCVSGVADRWQILINIIKTAQLA